MKKILVIGSIEDDGKNSPSELVARLNSNDVSADLIYWEDIVFDISRNAVHAFSKDKNIISDKPDLVIAIGWYKNGKKSIYRDVALSLAMILKHNCISFWNSEMINQRSTTKLSCMVQLALNDICVPRTYFCLENIKAQKMIDMPYIAKAAGASRGEMNYLINCEDDLRQINDDVHFIYQSYLKNDHDLRIICFDGKPKLILKRARVDQSTHLNNTSKGAKSSWLELSEVAPALLTISEKICKITGREMAGIDFIPDNSSDIRYSCLEVNAVPQLTSGTDSDKKMTAFLDAVELL